MGGMLNVEEFGEGRDDKEERTYARREMFDYKT